MTVPVPGPVPGCGRRLTVDVTGAPDGPPVFLLHGTPGSRTGPRPRDIVLYRLGVQLISYDRPGYGGSPRHPGRSVASAAHDVGAIATHLGLHTFAVVGRSGGGPHALACAALLNERVTRTAVLVGLAPANAPGLDWYGQMVDTNRAEYAASDDDPQSLIDTLTAQADAIHADPGRLIDHIGPGLTGADRRVLDDVAMRRLFTDTYREAVRYGADGWIDDSLALRRDWGFPLSAVAGPVRLWHGADDRFSPVSHTQWLATQIPQVEVDVEAGASHFGAVEVLPEILAWLTAPDKDPGDDDGYSERLRVDHPMRVASLP